MRFTNVVSSLRSGWRGILLVAVTYIYFLIFAQFAFLKRLADLGIADVHLKLAMAAMACGGIAMSLLAPVPTRHVSPAWRLRAAFLLCACAAVLTLLQLSLLACVLVSLLIGCGLGLLTVTLVTHLRQWLGAGESLLQVGLGTGIGYFFCNFPPFFTASPQVQAVVAAGLCAGGIFAAGGAGNAGQAAGIIEFPLPSSRREEAEPSFVRVLFCFTALVWFDSAAFFSGTDNGVSFSRERMPAAAVGRHRDCFGSVSGRCLAVFGGPGGVPGGACADGFDCIARTHGRLDLCGCGLGRFGDGDRDGPEPGPRAGVICRSCRRGHTRAAAVFTVAPSAAGSGGYLRGAPGCLWIAAGASSETVVRQPGFYAGAARPAGLHCGRLHSLSFAVCASWQPGRGDVGSGAISGSAAESAAAVDRQSQAGAGSFGSGKPPLSSLVEGSSAATGTVESRFVHATVCVSFR